MLRTIITLVSAPLWLATTKRKPSRVKPKRPAVRPVRVSRKKAKSADKHQKVSASSKKPLPSVPAELIVKAEIPYPSPLLPVAPLQAPGLFSPSPDEPAESLTPNFRWFYVGGASHYQLVWSSDPSFHRPHILLTNQTAAQLPLDQELEPGKEYVWRVRGGNEIGWGPWSAVRAFRTPEK